MRFPLDRVQTILDRYAALGKELHITEFTPASGGQRITGSHVEGVWDEAAQADYAVKFYRVCFAHPALRAITWWDLSDQHSWLKGGGMLRADMTPKPVYEQLKRLIHEEWTTRLAGTTDSTGRVRVPRVPRRLSHRGREGWKDRRAAVHAEEGRRPGGPPGDALKITSGLNPRPRRLRVAPLRGSMVASGSAAVAAAGGGPVVLAAGSRLHRMIEA